jgi:type I restriction-modification system DNA methylase subunit
MSKGKQAESAKAFVQRWAGRGYEKGESQLFWIELLQDVFGVGTPGNIISFENQVKLSSTSFIDAYIEPTHVLIEQKSIDKDLRKAIPQSDGTLLTPFQQAKRYAAELPYSKRPRWMVICNFREFHVYDMENPQGEPEVILLENLDKEYYRLQFLVEQGNEHLKKEMEVSLQAGEIIGEIYDEFLKQYINPDDPHTLKSLNILCVRLVFCLYAEDAGLFGEKRCMFHDYLAQFKPGKGEMRKGLIELFEVLNTPVEERDPYLDDSLKAFPYCNGGLFAEKNIEIPRFNDKLAELVLKHASDDFDWSQISPTIFGAVFESTLNPETRRSGGMHYTSIENIHKVIDPLFLDDLKAELASIIDEPIEKKRIQKAREYQDKLASLKFLDPACGSGNFLTETYLSLRRLENEVMPIIGDLFNPIKVDIHQFYGIEINDFAVATATTALWIAEAQMMAETERMLHIDLDFLPLKAYNNIREGNALRIDWDEVVPASELNYIMGNPPFSGARWMGKEQKDDVLEIFGTKWPGVGDLDYVCCWYKKATDYIKDSQIRCALVSTNSITQGGSVANLWKPLMEDYGVHIDFAWRTFRWDSEASIKAHVHCVVIGFSTAPNPKQKIIYDSSAVAKTATNINGYLIDSPNVAIESRKHPLCSVPEVGIGNKPIDGGFYLFSEDEMNEFIKSEPQAKAYFKPWYGAQEFINNNPRYCLWLGDCSPAELRRMPKCLSRVEAVKNYRLASPSPGTVKIADKPTRFHVENMPVSSYIVIPEVSSERRRYVPMGYMTPDVLCSNKVRLMPEASMFHFGILESNVHMAWMRAICGRLKSDYDYSIKIVYNNFPWPTPSDTQKARIEQTAQAILDARAKYPDCSLADLYDELTMPPELRKAHQENDKAVMDAYGFNWRTMTESDCVAELFKMYQKLTK